MSSKAIPTVRERLAALGQTAREVAHSLARAGVTGIRRSSRACPVARYLAREFEGAAFDATAASVFAGDRRVCSPPAAVAAFVVGFDAGMYPDLCGV